MAATALTISASGKTGATCSVTGPYRSSRNAKVIIFLKAGTKFPADTDGASTAWSFVNS
ncbi:MAG: hypothetical protein ACREUC_08240 [Steroidobacteraceae bacterium]